ncbi:hypothetical protein RUM43_009703 [Polyplax serrata]|uniref:Uncharacterized protein n=1 Tax=Polyplax serrata TaxID=468196 RepID=A0AAN8PJK8_POLSC
MQDVSQPTVEYPIQLPFGLIALHARGDFSKGKALSWEDMCVENNQPIPPREAKFLVSTCSFRTKQQDCFFWLSEVKGKKRWNPKRPQTALPPGISQNPI